MSHTTFNTKRPVNAAEFERAINAANDLLAKGELTIQPGSELSQLANSTNNALQKRKTKTPMQGPHCFAVEFYRVQKLRIDQLLKPQQSPTEKELLENNGLVASNQTSYESTTDKVANIGKENQGNTEKKESPTKNANITILTDSTPVAEELGQEPEYLKFLENFHNTGLVHLWNREPLQPEVATPKPKAPIIVEARNRDPFAELNQTTQRLLKFRPGETNVMEAVRQEKAVSWAPDVADNKPSENAAQFQERRHHVESKQQPKGLFSWFRFELFLKFLSSIPSFR